MEVSPEKARAKAEHAGRTYYFCCQGCQKKFESEPLRYLANVAVSGLVTLPPKSPAEPASGQAAVKAAKIQAPTKAPAAEYTCPMHPEVSQAMPGDCPKCGMALDPTAAAIPSATTEYICPMHTEIVRPEPGTCPVCGMALEPRVVTAVEPPNPELESMTQRFWVALFLTVPVVIAAMGEELSIAPLTNL